MIDYITKIQKCKLCPATKKSTIFKNGQKQKSVKSIKGSDCKHNWINL